jgi:hypothetical protein|nr:MAG TPA: hypothetical protein [Caudoviricetes sp.]
MLTKQETAKAEKDIERFKAYERLLKNVDFQKVILDGYLHDYPLELIYSIMLVDNEETQHRRLYGVGLLKQYLEQLKFAADTATEMLREDREEVNEL